MGLGPDFDTTLQAARFGAEWAWTQLYRDVSPDVLRYLKAQVAPSPDDLLGEVFLRVVRALPRFEGDERDFRAWVFTVARNVLRDAWRRAGRARIDYVSTEQLADVGEGDLTEAAVGRREAYARVVGLLGRLTPDQRDVVFLRIIAGLTIEETARVVDKSAGSVKSLQARALASMRREFSDEAVS